MFSQVSNKPKKGTVTTFISLGKCLGEYYKFQVNLINHVNLTKNIQETRRRQQLRRVHFADDEKLCCSNPWYNNYGDPSYMASGLT